MGDHLVLSGAVYTRTCVQQCRVVGLREPRKSDDSSDWPRVGHRIISMDVGTVSIWRDPRKSTLCEYLALTANLLGMKTSLMRLNGSSAVPVYLLGDWVGIWMITDLLSYSRCSALRTASGWIHAYIRFHSFIYSFIQKIKKLGTKIHFRR